MRDKRFCRGKRRKLQSSVITISYSEIIEIHRHITRSTHITIDNNHGHRVGCIVYTTISGDGILYRRCTGYTIILCIAAEEMKRFPHTRLPQPGSECVYTMLGKCSQM